PGVGVRQQYAGTRGFSCHCAFQERAYAPRGGRCPRNSGVSEILCVRRGDASSTPFGSRRLFRLRGMEGAPSRALLLRLSLPTRRLREVCGDEVVQTLVVIDETTPMRVMLLHIERLCLQAFVLRHEILVLSEKRDVFLGRCHVIHGLSLDSDP